MVKPVTLTKICANIVCIMAKKSSKTPPNVIIVNRKARHDFFTEQTFEAGLVLEGWEVKSLRAGHVQLRDSYVIIKDGEAWLLGSTITPLPTASTHINPVPQRTRKILLHKKEIAKLVGAINQKGYTIVAVNLHWTRNRVKVGVALAKGKQNQDKRETLKQRDWDREKHRILKKG
jgi:SsrA-binding protein